MSEKSRLIEGPDGFIELKDVSKSFRDRVIEEPGEVIKLPRQVMKLPGEVMKLPGEVMRLLDELMKLTGSTGMCLLEPSSSRVGT
jgi:hypothetical protein